MVCPYIWVEAETGKAEWRPYIWMEAETGEAAPGSQEEGKDGGVAWLPERFLIYRRAWMEEVMGAARSGPCAWRR